MDVEQLFKCKSLLLSFIQSGDVMLDMYGCVLVPLHHTPNDKERSLQVVAGSPTSEHIVAEDEHRFEFEIGNGPWLLIAAITIVVLTSSMIL